MLGLLAGAVLLFGKARTSPRNEVLIYADPGWVAGTIAKAKFVRATPNANCEVNLQGIAEAVAELFGAIIVESLPRDRSFFDIVSVCGLKESTFYYRPAAFELWINYCDLTVSSACLANKVFAFTDLFGIADWPCVREVIRQELVNYNREKLRRTLGVNCE